MELVRLLLIFCTLAMAPGPVPGDGIRCQLSIPHGRFSRCCSGQVGETCSDYRCDPGYRRKCDNDTLTCNPSGVWNHDTSLLCEALPLQDYNLALRISVGLGIVLLNLIIIMVILAVQLRKLRQVRRQLIDTIVSKDERRQDDSSTYTSTSFAWSKENEYSEVSLN